jgi:exonuclease III
MTVITIATLNVNALQSRTKANMLQAFLRSHAIDILFVQEVVQTEPFRVGGFTAHINLGKAMRGTGFLVRDGLHLEQVVASPSGRALVAQFRGIKLLNVYASSGTSKKAERDKFYNLELPPLWKSGCSQVVVGGDFNCVLHPADVQGHFSTSIPLRDLVQGYGLRDAWTQNVSSPSFTHFHANGASRIDRFYMTAEMCGRKTGIRVLPVAFSDHCAVELRFDMPMCALPRPSDLGKSTRLLQRTR